MPLLSRSVAPFLICLGVAGSACGGGVAHDGTPPPTGTLDLGQADAPLDASAGDLGAPEGFPAAPRVLTLELRGPAGAVRVDPGGASGALRCEVADALCRFTLPLGTPLRITPEPGDRARFSGFEGACEGTDDCHRTLETDLRVVAVFAPALRTLTVERRGEGEGRVVGGSAASALDCGARCALALPLGSVVELLAVPGRGSVFEGFSGACTGVRCRFVLEGDAGVVSAFARESFPLRVALDGGGEGSVASAAGDVACPGDCSAPVRFGTVKRLEATAAHGSRFAGWAGDCAGESPRCDVVVERATSVSARFERRLFPLRVAAVGRAAGDVDVVPVGVPCVPEEAGCTRHPFGEALTLRARWDPGTTRFDGWEGDCAGTAEDCVLRVSGPLEARARFSPQPRRLQVLRDGSGGAFGDFALAGGISCGVDCWTFDHGARITVQALDTDDARHLGWTGCDALPGHRGRSCEVTMDEDRSVRAAFVRRRVLAVEVVGIGAVGVSGGVPSASVCESTVRSGATCAVRVDEGADVRLTAVQRRPTWYFARWSSGPCLPEPRGCLTQLFGDERSVAVFRELI